MILGFFTIAKMAGEVTGHGVRRGWCPHQPQSGTKIFILDSVLK